MEEFDESREEDAEKDCLERECEYGQEASASIHIQSRCPRAKQSDDVLPSVLLSRHVVQPLARVFT